MLVRIMNNQVWFDAYLRDTSGKGGSVLPHCTFCPSPPSSGGCLWFWLEIPHSAIAMAVSTAPIAATTTLPALMQAEELETAALCTLWTPGRWAGQVTPEVQWSVASRCDSQTFVLHIITYYIILLHPPLLCIITISIFVITSLLHIITFAIITHYSLLCITWFQFHVGSTLISCFESLWPLQCTTEVKN